MSKLISSERILKRAKSFKKESNTTKKLTQLKNEFAIEAGYSSFSDAESQEQKRKVEERTHFAMSGSTSKNNILKEVHKGIALYVREDGRRGLKA